MTPRDGPCGARYSQPVVHRGVTSGRVPRADRAAPPEPTSEERGTEGSMSLGRPGPAAAAAAIVAAHGACDNSASSGGIPSTDTAPTAPTSEPAAPPPLCPMPCEDCPPLPRCSGTCRGLFNPEVETPLGKAGPNDVTLCDTDGLAQGRVRAVCTSPTDDFTILASTDEPVAEWAMGAYSAHRSDPSLGTMHHGVRRVRWNDRDHRSRGT